MNQNCIETQFWIWSNWWIILLNGEWIHGFWYKLVLFYVVILIPTRFCSWINVRQLQIIGSWWWSLRINNLTSYVLFMGWQSSLKLNHILCMCAAGIFHNLQEYTSWSSHLAHIISILETMACTSIKALEHLLLPLPHGIEGVHTCYQWYVKHWERDQWCMWLQM